jgi:hypothetical protein
VEGEAGVLKERVQVAAVHRGLVEPQEGVRGEEMKRRNATPMEACTASTRALSGRGRLRPNQPAEAPKSARIRIQRRSEPRGSPRRR